MKRLAHKPTTVGESQPDSVLPCAYHSAELSIIGLRHAICMFPAVAGEARENGVVTIANQCLAFG